MVLTGLNFVAVTGIVRHLGSDIPAAQAAFIRYGLGLVLILPLMGGLLRGGLGAGLMWRFTLRGVAHGGAVILWFYAMARIPIAEVTAIGYMSPIYIAIGAAIFLGERLAARRIGAILAGFAGAMIILRPGFQDINAGQTAQLIAAPIFAVSYLLAKPLSMRASPVIVVGMLSLFVTAILAPVAWYVWEPVGWSEVAWLGLVAAFATTGHWTMTRALAAAPLAVTQPITFLQLVWAMLLGALVFDEGMDAFVLLGGGVIIASVSFISYREWKLGRRAGTPPAVATKQ